MKNNINCIASPVEVLSLANYTSYYKNFDYDNFPATRFAKGYEVILEHGNTLFMPAGSGITWDISKVV